MLSDGRNWSHEFWSTWAEIRCLHVGWSKGVLMQVVPLLCQRVQQEGIWVQRIESFCIRSAKSARSRRTFLQSEWMRLTRATCENVTFLKLNVKFSPLWSDAPPSMRNVQKLTVFLATHRQRRKSPLLRLCEIRQGKKNRKSRFF